MIFIALLFFAFFVNPVQISAAPVVTINNIPDNNIIGENFSVDFTINNADIGSSFYYKIFGGIGDTTSSIQNFYNNDYLNYTSSWADFPVLTISTTSATIATAYGKVNNEQSSLYNIRVRIAKVSNTSSKYDSEAKIIDCLLPTLIPTNTPVSANTPIPTNTPILTITKNPTPTSTPKPTNNAVPSATPILTTAKIPSLIPTIEALTIVEPTEEILGITDMPTIKPIKTDSPTNFIPTILIILGALLLFTPLILSKIKHCPKKFLKK